MSDIDAQLAALENAAPLTEEPTDADIIVDVGGEPVVEADAAPADPAKKPDEVAAKPPLKPEEIAQRYDQVKIALREERAQRRAERAALQAEQQKMEEAFQKIQARLTAPPAPQYDPNQQFTYEDAVAELWQERQQQTYQQQQEAARRAQLTEQQQAQEREFTALQTTMSEYEADLRDEAPDYDAAVQHLTGAWDSQFEILGYSPDQRQAMIQNLSVNAVQVALKAGRDPARAIYDAAKKVGYAPAAGAVNGNANGAQKLAQMQAGAAAAKTLSGGGSGVQGEGLTLKQLAGLEGAAFDSAMEKLRKSAR